MGKRQNKRQGARMTMRRKYSKLSVKKTVHNNNSKN